MNEALGQNLELPGYTTYYWLPHSVLATEMSSTCNF